ncbi:MAG: NADH-quinone oxidoreductase subunit NuoN, partial [Bacteroidetes bacterium]
VILCIDLIKSDLDKTLYVTLTMLTLFIALGAVLSLNINERGMFGTILIDGVSVLGQVLIIAGSMLFIPLALTKRRFHDFSYPEFFSLFLFMVFGFQFMAASDNLILIFVGLETASLALYTLIAMHNTRLAHEAAIKYFTMGALAAGFFAMGAAIIYATTGSVEIDIISKVLLNRINEAEILIPIIGGALFMTVAIGLKVSLIPFHMWTPDAYEGASAPMAGYMSIVPKIAMMVVAIRLFGIYMELDITIVKTTIIALAIVTTTAANMMALVQKDVKRMLAYSSISHAGFVLVAIALDTTKVYSSIFLYYGLFMFTNLGAFTMLWISRHKYNIHHDRFHHPYEKFAGMIKKAPIAAVIMAVFMLSLAGVPPFSLFWGKLYILSAIVDSGYYTVAIIMALNSAIAVYYYLKLIVYMFLKPAEENAGKVIYANRAFTLELVIGIAAFVTITSIFYINPLMSFITDLVGASGY